MFQPLRVESAGPTNSFWPDAGFIQREGRSLHRSKPRAGSEGPQLLRTMLCPFQQPQDGTAALQRPQAPKEQSQGEVDARPRRGCPARYCPEHLSLRNIFEGTYVVFNSLLVDESRSVASSIPQKLKPFVFVWLLLSAARGFICQVCNARFTSMEMYQAHMKGNKHQVK